MEMDYNDSPYTKYQAIQKTGMAMRYTVYLFIASLVIIGVIFLALQQTNTGIFASNSHPVSSSSSSTAGIRSSSSSTSSSSSSSISFSLDNIVAKPYIAVSLRQLFSNVVRAIQVTRNYDAATLDINFDSNGRLDTTSLINFIIAGGSSSHDASISIWYDQSGNNNNLVTAYSSVTPAIAINRLMLTSSTNLIPGVLFSGTQGGTSYQLALPSAGVMTNTGQFSIVVDRTNGTQGNILDYAPNLNSPDNYDSSPGYLFASCTDDVCGANSIVQINDTIKSDTATGKTVRWPGGLSVITVITNNPTGTDTAWNNIGKDRNGMNNYNGYYYELMAFSTHISTNDQLIVSKSQSCFYRNVNC